MSDTAFSIEHWLFWKQLLYWSLNIIGFGSALYALNSYNFDDKKNTTAATLLLMVWVIILLGWFPIEWHRSTDREHYALNFLCIKGGVINTIHKNEIGFIFYQRLLAKVCSVKGFMIVSAIVYVVNYTICVFKLTEKRAYWLLLAIVLSMGFVSYSINTMRAGLALSFVVLALSMTKSKWRMLCCLIVAILIHNSVFIPCLMIFISYFYDNTPLYCKLWVLSIPISLVAGNWFNVLFSGFGEDARASYLLQTHTHYNVGFRIDFIIYSLAPILIGWYYIYKKDFQDRVYTLIYNSYILTNIFWILVIRANFSDRFAYLSWFLLPFILVYPLLKEKMDIKENYWLFYILLGETLFRCIM